MIINVKSETDLSGFYVIYRGSVLNERKGVFGIHHLLEHLICHQFDDMMDDFDRCGIAWNAYTSENEICFYFTGLDEYLTKYRDKILEKLLIFSITEEQFTNEKKIVLEEYTKYFNSQSDNHAMNLARKLFNSYGPIGLKEDLQNLTYQDVKNYFDLQFSKPHLIINVSKHNEFKAKVNFSDVTYDDVIKMDQYNVPIEPYKSRNGKTSVIDVSQVITEDFAYVSFITAMLGDGLKSPLYQEVREKRGLVYGISCYLDRMTPNSGLVVIAAETADENVDELQATIESVLSNPEQFMTKERFDIVKQSYEIRLKKNAINRYNNVGKYITPREWQIEPILKDLTLEKMMVVYNKYFNFNNFYKSLDTKEFENQ